VVAGPLPWDATFRTSLLPCRSYEGRNEMNEQAVDDFANDAPLAMASNGGWRRRKSERHNERVTWYEHVALNETGADRCAMGGGRYIHSNELCRSCGAVPLCKESPATSHAYFHLAKKRNEPGTNKGLNQGSRTSWRSLYRKRPRTLFIHQCLPRRKMPEGSVRAKQWRKRKRTMVRSSSGWLA
jgi:hypothetical protein